MLKQEWKVDKKTVANVGQMASGGSQEESAMIPAVERPTDPTSQIDTATRHHMAECVIAAMVSLIIYINYVI